MNDIQQLKRYVVQSKELNEPLNYFFDLVDADAFSKIKSHRAIKTIDHSPELKAVVQLVKEQTNKRLGKSIKQLIPILHEIPDTIFITVSVCLLSWSCH